MFSASLGRPDPPYLASKCGQYSQEVLHRLPGFSITYLRIRAYLDGLTRNSSEIQEMSTTTIWRLPEVLRQTGLSRSTIYEMISRGDFPQQVQLGRRAVGWIAEDVLDWIRAKVDADLADSPTSTA